MLVEIVASESRTKWVMVYCKRKRPWFYGEKHEADLNKVKSGRQWKLVTGGHVL